MPPLPNATRPADVPEGRCWCGCGQKTLIATRTNNAHGIKRGQPVRFVAGHYKRHPATPCDGILRACPHGACDLMVHTRGHAPCEARHPIATSAGGCTGCGRRRAAVPKLDPAIAADEWDHFGDVLGYTPKQFGEQFGYTAIEGIRRVMLELPKDHPSRVSFEAAHRREVDRAAGRLSHPRAAHIGSIGSPGKSGTTFAMTGRRIA